MTPRETLFEELMLLGAQADLKRVERAGALFTLRDQEIVYSICEVDGLFIVQTSERGGGPVVRMAAEDLEVAARGLLVLLIEGPLGENRPVPPSLLSRQLAPGVSLEPDVDGLRLRSSAGGAENSAWVPDSSSGRRMAAMLSGLLDEPVSALVRRLSAPGYER